jgi:small subunit ribosomal protein S4
MGRYTGPVEKLSRREGVQLFLKGERVLVGKSAIDRRGPVPPGQHGPRRRRPSEYGLRLREKQRAKRYYGVRERQFRRYFALASRRRGERTGTALLRLLESRLDNVIYRLGFAATRAQARQFVSHGHVEVNGRRLTIASARLRPGDVVALRPASPVAALVRAATETVGRVPGWLQADFDALRGAVLRAPARGEIDAPISEQLIVEFYSRG